MLRVTVDGARFSNAQPVFEVPGIYDFDTAHRTDRFVVARSTDSAMRSPTHVIVNWTALLDTFPR